MNEEQFNEIFQKDIKDLEESFHKYMPDKDGYPKTVVEAMYYSLEAGGKRLRPEFIKKTYEMLGGQNKDLVEPFMVAMEMIHTYSLVHDDLPAMDDDDYRRGKLSTHKKYGEAVGILTGDSLLNRAFETAFVAFDQEGNEKNIVKALKVLGSKAGIDGMGGGQTVDVENDGKFVDQDTLLYVYKNKTAALIEASFMIGAILAGAEDEIVNILEKIATSIGMAFQIRDDILDVCGDEEIIGKPINSDQKNEKSTYVAIYGLEHSREKVEEYTKAAIDNLKKIEVENEQAREFLEILILKLINRNK